MKRKYNYDLHLKMLQQGIKQKDLARMVGLNQTTISVITTGTLIPDERVKLRIAKALGSSVEEVFKD